MIAEYGRDAIAEFWRGEISLRKLRVLIEGLPSSSALHRALAGNDWQVAEYQRADVIDALSVLVEDGRTLHSEGHTWQQPAVYPRPETPDVKPIVRKPSRLLLPAPGVKSLAEQIAIATGQGV